MASEEDDRIFFYDPNLSDFVKSMTKSSNTAIFIAGRYTHGEALIPHFQISTKAKIEYQEKIKNMIMIKMVKNVGQFGLS